MSVITLKGVSLAGRRWHLRMVPGTTFKGIFVRFTEYAGKADLKSTCLVLLSPHSFKPRKNTPVLV